MFRPSAQIAHKYPNTLNLALSRTLLLAYHRVVYRKNQIKSIRAIIRIGGEIQCLPYAEFLWEDLNEMKGIKVH